VKAGPWTLSARRANAPARKPSHCAVPEDLLSGVRAANAAGMRVLDAHAISELGTDYPELLDSMDELPALLLR
jgi:beta-phosphoglucomutase-like phosphatase (HAD superfamily)